MFKNYSALPADVFAQIQRTAGIFRSRLRGALTGVYVHGSIALSCFTESSSDIDLLIVCERRIPRDERLSIAEAVIAIDKKPRPLEISALFAGDIIPWQYPPPCQFHYSETWTERYKQLLSGEITGHFIIDDDFEDSDIACHIKLTKQCGIRVCGKPIDEVFPDIPEADFWDSISGDINEDYDFNAYAPRYFASNIINIARVLSYKAEKRVLSKYEVVEWAKRNLPERFLYIIEGAGRAWFFGEAMPECRGDDLAALKRVLIDKIQGGGGL